MKISELMNGLWNENPVLRLVIGLCPVLAVTTAAFNGLAMGLATTFVLIASGLFISLLKNLIPRKIRIPSYIVIIATFVTVADLVMAAYYPAMHKILGIYIPLIVVNCIILGRMEAFASKNRLGSSLLDAFGMGLGFTWVLVFLGGIREILGAGELFGISVGVSNPALMFVLPPGAFLVLGLMIAGMNLLKGKPKAVGCAGCHGGNEK